MIFLKRKLLLYIKGVVLMLVLLQIPILISASTTKLFSLKSTQEIRLNVATLLLLTSAAKLKVEKSLNLSFDMEKLQLKVLVKKCAEDAMRI